MFISSYNIFYGMVFCSTGKVIMFLKVAILARLRFHRDESISSIAWKRYSGEVLIAIRKFE